MCGTDGTSAFRDEHGKRETTKRRPRHLHDRHTQLIPGALTSAGSDQTDGVVPQHRAQPVIVQVPSFDDPQLIVVLVGMLGKSVPKTRPSKPSSLTRGGTDRSNRWMSLMKSVSTIVVSSPTVGYVSASSTNSRSSGSRSGR